MVHTSHRWAAVELSARMWARRSSQCRAAVLTDSLSAHTSHQRGAAERTGSEWAHRSSQCPAVVLTDLLWVHTSHRSGAAELSAICWVCAWPPDRAAVLLAMPLAGMCLQEAAVPVLVSMLHPKEEARLSVRPRVHRLHHLAEALLSE